MSSEYIKNCTEAWTVYLGGYRDPVYFERKVSSALTGLSRPLLMSLTSSQVERIGAKLIESYGFVQYAETKNPNTGRKLIHYVRQPDQ